jgi:DNA-binding CsgD family transcriptional regulator
MRHLRQRDFHAILEIVEELYSYQAPEECMVGMVRSLQRVIGCDSFHMSGINPGLRRARWSSSWASGPTTSMPNVREVFERHMHEHPFLEHWDGGQAVFKPATLSDLVSRPSWRNTALYNEVYRPFRIEHMLGVAVRVSRPNKMHVVAMRETIDFDDRDRRVLGLLGPHLEAGYRYAEAVSDLKAQLATLLQGLETDGSAAILLGPDRGIRQMSPRARDLLAEYFRGRWIDRRALPAPVDDWLRRQGLTAAASVAPLRPLVAERDGRRLTIQLLRSHGGPFLLLSERKLRISPADIASLGLSPRETEVLAWLAHGKSNAEIADILGLSPATIKHCLERVYGKLDVGTRAAATAVAVAAAGMHG